MAKPPPDSWGEPSAPPDGPFEVKGKRNRVAEHEYRRREAASFYLVRWRELGHEEAARLTCEKFGHDPAGKRCRRCGLGIAARRNEALRARREAALSEMALTGEERIVGGSRYDRGDDV